MSKMYLMISCPKKEVSTWEDSDEQVFLTQPIDGAVSQEYDKTLNLKQHMSLLYFQIFDWSDGLSVKLNKLFCCRCNNSFIQMY